MAGPDLKLIAAGCLAQRYEKALLEELPEIVTMTCPPVKGRIMFQCKQIGNQISVSYRFTLDMTQILPESYQDLRLFWEKAAGIEKSTIVLKKQ